MVISESEFKALKNQAAAARHAHDRTAGQLEASMTRLRDEFGCKNLDEANTLLTKLTRETTKAEEKYNKAADEFKEAWSEHL